MEIGRQAAGLDEAGRARRGQRRRLDHQGSGGQLQPGGQCLKLDRLHRQRVCTDSAIGCAISGAPSSFTLRLRPQGWSFDWGNLRWCQFYDTPWPDGCFDVEMITLHEFGHVQGLGHIDDAPDPGTAADWLDSIMHGVSRAKNKSGWNAHAFGPCDVASLQAAYRPETSSTLISTCHDLATTATVSAAANVVYRAT